nr:LysR substrate-binding domain-containing protein [Comamonas jiangduensis]
MPPVRGIVFFAHGSRDPRWSLPIAAVADALQQQCPDALSTCAYLELTEPDLPTAPSGHRLATKERIGLDDLADEPLITYHPSFTGRGKVDAAFATRKIAPRIVLEAIDSDVIKTYVRLGLGIGIVAEMAMREELGPDLVSRPMGHLFGQSVARVAFKRGAYLRNFVYKFAETLSDRLSRDLILRAMSGHVNDYEL